MENKIAACMILGDQYRKEELVKTIESLKNGGVDKLFINFNGTAPIMEQTYDLCEEIDIPFLLKKFNWEDNFAKARTQSFDLVPKEEFDWILWIDSDDILVVETNLQDVVKDIDSTISGLFLRYDYAVEPSTGQVIVEQWRERLLRTDTKWEWVHPIHEVCLGPPGTQFVRKSGAYIQHLRTSGEDRGARERNRRIIARAKREDPDVPRYVFYFAGETMAEADIQEDIEKKKRLSYAAIEAFVQFKEMLNEVNDDYFVAQIRIAECYRMAGDFIDAFEADLESIAIYPGWPDGYIGAAKSCMELGDFSRMKAFADIATKIPKPITAASIETMNSGFTPYFLRAIANEGLGEIENAISDYRKSIEFWHPPNNKVEDKLRELEKIKNQEIPVDDRPKLFGSKPDKSIAFVTNPIPENWHPELMKQTGSGGAELCIMKLAPMFASDGWRVSVFGTPGDYRGVYEDGVEYWNSEEFSLQEKFKVLISSRTGTPFTVDLNADKKLLWMHDVNIGPDFNKIAQVPDKIIALTPWHKKHLSTLYKIPEEKIAIIPNGIDISRFPKKYSQRTNLGHRFIWSSSYDRGLETLLALWPQIKRFLPDASLNIFYGWNMYDKSIEQWSKFNENQAKALQLFKNKIEGQMQLLGASGEADIVHHGRVDQDTLADWMINSDIWPYTTMFMETFCITAIEMQAAGVIPITSKLAALTDNIAVPELMIEGWPQNVTYQNQFLDKLDAVVSASEDDIVQAREEGRRLAESYTWENAYSKWNDLLLSE